MVSEAKIKWVRKHKAFGDISQAVRNLNAKGHAVTYSEAGSIVCGDLHGKWGNLVWAEMERIIRKRQKQFQKETEKYAA